MPNNSASVLITTYNWEGALQKVLETILRQSQLPKEVVIADDGSTSATANVINAYQKLLPIPLIHCWQEDKGFRAAAIRNKAIAAMTADYVVMIDGDMLLHHHFIRDHVQAAKKGFFIQGSRAITSPCLARSILDGRHQGVSQLGFLSLGISNRLNALNSSFLSRFFSQYDTGLRSTKTCNFSAWKDDLLAINGFNEGYVGWGREDSDLVARLLHSGKKRLKLKCMANAYHLHHEDNSRNRLSQNDSLLEQCLQEQQIYCTNGIDKYLGGS
jgi:glycosyltransferase involved in cell wall biosynthesis